MRMFPIIPVWLMFILCIFLIIFIIKHNKKDVIQISIVVLIFIINLRIMIPSNDSQVLSNNLDVLFVIDNTISMNAEDYNGTTPRLDAVKKDCNYIINKLNGARFSLITFNNSAKIVIPFTRDSNITTESIEIIETIELLYAKGSSLNTPIKTIVSSLEASKNQDNRKKVLFFISDGEITDDSKLKSFKEIAKYVDNGTVLGYGTTKGGYMRTSNKYSNEKKFVMDYSTYNYGKAVSKLDEDNLKKIASDIDGEYIHMEKQSNIDKRLKEIHSMTNSSTESSDKSTYEDTYYLLIAPLLILLMIEINKFRRKAIWKKY